MRTRVRVRVLACVCTCVRVCVRSSSSLLVAVCEGGLASVHAFCLHRHFLHSALSSSKLLPRCLRREGPQSCISSQVHVYGAAGFPKPRARFRRRCVPVTRTFRCAAVRCAIRLPPRLLLAQEACPPPTKSGHVCATTRSDSKRRKASNNPSLNNNSAGAPPACARPCVQAHQALRDTRNCERALVSVRKLRDAALVVLERWWSFVLMVVVVVVGIRLLVCSMCRAWRVTMAASFKSLHSPPPRH